MATFITLQGKKGIKTQAVIRTQGHNLSRVFSLKRDAEAWAKRTEVAIECSTKERPFVKFDHLPKKTETEPTVQVSLDLPHIRWTLSKALDHYGQTITKKKKGYAQELRRIAQWQRLPLVNKLLSELTTAHIQSFIDRRASEVSGSTVRHDVMLIRALYRDARKIWKLDIPNPCVGAELPRPAHHRERRLEDARGVTDQDEEHRLREALSSYNRGDELTDLLDLAIETGLRRSELLYLRVKHIRTSAGLTRVELEGSKSGRPRRVILSLRAREIIFRRLKDKDENSRLFSVSESALARFWIQARKEAKVEGLRWHDLRHEALSRMASKGLNIEQLQAQAGYTTPTMILRYFPVCYQDIADKLR